jgi:hypothetical protein
MVLGYMQQLGLLCMLCNLVLYSALNISARKHYNTEYHEKQH